MKRLGIIGSGDLGQQIAYHAFSDQHYQPIGFFDDFQPVGTIIKGYPVIGTLNDIMRLYASGSFDVAMIGIGYKHFSLRASLFERFQSLIPFGSVIHSSSYIDKSCRFGQGVFIYPGCTLDMNVVLGDNVLINAGCIIAHDSSIDSHSFLSPGVRVAGFVRIGEASNLGIGTIVIDNINIGSQVRTGAGAVIVRDLTTSGLYVGIPAKLKSPL